MLRIYFELSIFRPLFLYKEKLQGQKSPLKERTPWRNGSASDSRSEGCVFKSRRGQTEKIFFLSQDSRRTEGKIIQNRTFFMNMAEPASPDTKWVSKLNFSA